MHDTWHSSGLLIKKSHTHGHARTHTQSDSVTTEHKLPPRADGDIKLYIKSCIYDMKNDMYSQTPTFSLATIYQ